MSRPSVVELVRPFVVGGVAYLLLGSGLGAEMAEHPRLVADWRSIHAHLNVFGFLTFLIVGMTYLFVPVFARRRLVRPQWVRIHLWVAHVAVWGLILGRLFHLWPLSAAGGLAQLGSTILFAAVVVLTIRRGEPVAPADLPPLLASIAAAPASRDLDRTATGFTRLALIYFAAGGVLGAVLGGPSGFSPQFVASTIWFTVVGVIVIMLCGVAYHLIPRLNGLTVRRDAAAQWQYWGLVVAAPVLGVAYFEGWMKVAGLAHLVEAASLGLFAWNLWPALAAGRMPAASRGFIRMALLFGFAGALLAATTVLGIGRPLPRAPLLHLHLLGLATMTAFGVMYALLRQAEILPATARWPAVHVWIASTALPGMAVGLSGPRMLLAIFGPLQFLGILGFAVTLVRYLVRSGSQPYTGKMSTGA